MTVADPFGSALGIPHMDPCNHARRMAHRVGDSEGLVLGQIEQNDLRTFAGPFENDFMSIAGNIEA